MHETQISEFLFEKVKDSESPRALIASMALDALVMLASYKCAGDEDAAGDYFDASALALSILTKPDRSFALIRSECARFLAEESYKASDDDRTTETVRSIIESVRV